MSSIIAAIVVPDSNDFAHRLTRQGYSVKLGRRHLGRQAFFPSHGSGNDDGSEATFGLFGELSEFVGASGWRMNDSRGRHLGAGKIGTTDLATPAPRCG